MVYQTATIVIGIVTIVSRLRQLWLIVTVVKMATIVVTSPLHMDCGLETWSTAVAVELWVTFQTPAFGDNYAV